LQGVYIKVIKVTTQTPNNNSTLVWWYIIYFGGIKKTTILSDPREYNRSLGAVAGRACCCVVMAVAILLSRFLNIYIRIQDLNGFPRSQEIWTDRLQ
jgi:hypothetical protein